MSFIHLFSRSAHTQPAVLDSIALDKLRQAIRMQPGLPPPSRVRHRLMAAIRLAPRPLPAWFVDLWTVTVTLACFLILWGFVQPGIVLSWQANPQPGSAFRIYRSDFSGTAYILLAEIPADEQSYRYTDSTLLPGTTYQYHVELLGPTGIFAHHSITVSGWQAVWGMLTVLLGSLVLSAAITAWHMKQISTIHHHLTVRPT